MDQASDIDLMLAAGVTGKPEIQTGYMVPMPKELKRLQETKQESKSGSEDDDSFWIKTISEVAIAQGAQFGLKYRYEAIVRKLEKRSARLDTLVDFNQFILDGKVLIPSVQVVHSKMERLSDTELAQVNAQFTIEEEARIVTSIPSWRNYLIRSFEQPEPPPVSARPKNTEEQKIWKPGIEKGWKMGVTQANDIFRDSLAELLRDIRGRQNYLDLENMNMVSFPVLDQSKAKITFNGRTMNSGEVIHTITRPGNWKPTGVWKAFWQEPGKADYDLLLEEALDG